MTTTPRTWSVGEVVTAAYMNAEIRDQFGSFFGSWSTWSPTWLAEGGAEPTLGNGELSGRYLKVGRTVDWVLQLRWGSTTQPGGGGGSENWAFVLPTPPATGFTYRVASADAYDSSSGLHYSGHAVYSTSDGGVVKTFVSALGDVGGIWDSSLPFTWGTADYLYAWGRYEAGA